jgi:multisubunit Na+/H+ antiporter MnhB subunit
MARHTRHLFALIGPPVLGVIGGLVVGTVLYNRTVREIEARSHQPANVAVPDLTDVLFGYTALSVFVGALIGILVGVFVYTLLKNRNAERQTSIGPPNKSLDASRGSVFRMKLY